MIKGKRPSRTRTGGGWAAFKDLCAHHSHPRVPHPCVSCKGGRRYCLCYLICREETGDRRGWHYLLSPDVRTFFEVWSKGNWGRPPLQREKMTQTLVSGATENESGSKGLNVV